MSCLSVIFQSDPIGLDRKLCYTMAGVRWPSRKISFLVNNKSKNL